MHSVAHLIHAYGLLVVAGFIGLESMCIPLPGETALIVGSVIAGRTHELNIVEVILTAAVASLIGRIIGYAIGWRFGHWLLLRYGPYVRITETRIKLGQYLFLKHGGVIIIIAQFMPVMRAIAGVLAGANRMPWRRFVLSSAVGVSLWAVRSAWAVTPSACNSRDWRGRGGFSRGRAVGSCSASAPSLSFRFSPYSSADTRRSGPQRPNAPYRDRSGCAKETVCPHPGRRSIAMCMPTCPACRRCCRISTSNGATASSIAASILWNRSTIRRMRRSRRVRIGAANPVRPPAASIRCARRRSIAGISTSRSAIASMACNCCSARTWRRRSHGQ